MSLAARLKMFEQAASDNAAGMRPGSAATKGRPTWGAARGPSLADQIKQIADNDSSLTRVDLSNQAAYQCKPDEYTGQIAAAIKKNNYVQELRLEGCGLGDREAAVLAEGIAANTSITILDLQKNRINNDGGAALAKGIANNTTLVEINLMNQSNARWGDGCLDAFLAMFDTNITLLKINWRLESRKSFALNKMITRNNEIDRRKKNGMDYNDLLPTALKGIAEGKENIPAHSVPAPAPAPVSSTAPVVSGGVPDQAATRKESPPPVHQPQPAAASSSTLPKPSANGGGGWAGGKLKPPNGAGAGAGAGVGAGVGSEEQKPLAGVPKVKRPTPSVLSRWPPAQQET